MSVERIKQLYADFTDALGRLQEALNEDLSKGSIIVDGTIQRFEFTFELSWRLTRVILNHNGIDVQTPRLVIKEAFKAKMIEDGEGWIDMLEDRNKTSHIYDEKEALKIYQKIKNSHFKLLKNHKDSMAKFINS